MSKIDELKQLAFKLNEITASIEGDNFQESRKAAPVIVHQRFCFELVQMAKGNEGKDIKEVPAMNRILTAIEVLEEYYPVLKSNK